MRQNTIAKHFYKTHQGSRKLQFERVGIENNNMKTIGRIFGIVSLILMVIGIIPFFGWLNWITIPLAILGLLLSIIGKSKGGIVICAVAIIFGICRLMLGGGIV